MSYELIISEKPQAAQKIAQALADTTAKKIREKQVNYFSLTHKGKQIIVASAVGHLYGLAEKGGESWEYPVFETEWKPIYKTNKAADYTKNYIKVLEELAENADDVTVASDFDIEGEVIGLNVVRFALGRSDAKRMKFSTLTKNDLVKAYENKLPRLEWGQAKAGDTRHHLDWFYGINLSRAFTTSIKKGTNQFKVLSTGRVQAPALHFLAERERKIQAFKPEPFSEIYLHGESKGVELKAQYEEEKIFDKTKAQNIVEQTTNKDGKVTDITKRTFKQAVPTPFDLTSLQMEASTMLGLSPKRTLEIAQKLYVEGIISYPRTSSQKLPSELNLKSVLKNLEKQPIYREKVAKVFEINSQIKPNEGKKSDPAHPAIHPTGETPKKLEGQDQRLYDLIVKRFFSLFGKPAVRETNTVKIEINSYIFILKGTRTIEKNWHELYEPYLKFEEVELPKLEEEQAIKNKEIEEIEKETSPPKRYTDASIIKELEKRNLGTKATRAEILNHLKQRGYITDKSIKVTELGLEMDEILSSEVPLLVDEKLTRQFEEEMEEIREEKSTPEKVLKLAKGELSKILDDIKSKEISLGEKLAGASYIAKKEMSKVGKCNLCEKGTLVLRIAKKTRTKFIGCDQYPDCKNIFKAPQAEIVKGAGKDCEVCGYPLLFVSNSEGGRIQKVCINSECSTKHHTDKDGNDIEKESYPEENMQCPHCEEGKMVLRKGFYGSFLGCNNYPKCKTMMKIVDGKVDVDHPISPKAKKKKSTKKKAPSKKKKN